MKKINEGFWDSVVDKAKRATNSAAAAVGSKSAQGRLSAQNLAKNFYDAYKVWLGSTGAEQTSDSMAGFLKTEIEMRSEFSNKWGSHFDVFQSDPKGFLAGQEEDVDASDTTATTGSDASQPEAQSEKPGGPDLDGDGVKPLDQQIYNMFKRHTIASGFTGSRNGYRFNKAPDGSFIVVGDNEVADFEKIVGWNIDAAELANELHDAGMMKHWDEFKASNTKYGDGMKIARDAMMAAADKLGKNYIKELNRFVLMTPKEAVPFQLKESVLMEGGVSDGQLRGFFLKVAQDALRTGEAKSAAKSEFSRHRLTNKVAAPQATTGSEPNTIDNSESEPRNEQPVEVALAGLNLSDSQQELLHAIEGDNGPGVANLIKVDSNKEVEKLAKRIVFQALRDYKAKRLKK
jgi:hypothetical protein